MRASIAVILHVSLLVAAVPLQRRDTPTAYQLCATTEQIRIDSQIKKSCKASDIAFTEIGTDPFLQRVSPGDATTKAVEGNKANCDHILELQTVTAIAKDSGLCRRLEDLDKAFKIHFPTENLPSVDLTNAVKEIVNDGNGIYLPQRNNLKKADAVRKVNAGKADQDRCGVKAITTDEVAKQWLGVHLYLHDSKVEGQLMAVAKSLDEAVSTQMSAFQKKIDEASKAKATAGSSNKQLTDGKDTKNPDGESSKSDGKGKSKDSQSSAAETTGSDGTQDTQKDKGKGKATEESISETKKTEDAKKKAEVVEEVFDQTPFHTAAETLLGCTQTIATFIRSSETLLKGKVSTSDPAPADNQVAFGSTKATELRSGTVVQGSAADAHAPPSKRPLPNTPGSSTSHVTSDKKTKFTREMKVFRK